MLLLVNNPASFRLQLHRNNKTTIFIRFLAYFMFDFVYCIHRSEQDSESSQGQEDDKPGPGKSSFSNIGKRVRGYFGSDVIIPIQVLVIQPRSNMLFSCVIGKTRQHV